MGPIKAVASSLGYVPAAAVSGVRGRPRGGAACSRTTARRGQQRPAPFTPANKHPPLTHVHPLGALGTCCS